MEFVSSEELKIKEVLISRGSLSRYSKGSSIYQEGDGPRALYYVQSGLVGLVKVTAQGVESLLRVFKVGQFFGHRSLFSNEPYHAGARALENSEILVIEKQRAIEVFDQEPRAYYFLARSLAKELRRAENRSLMISEMQLQERVASALLLFKKLKPDHLWTRTEIANYCASRTPTVIKTLSQIEEAGAIRQDGRRIEIVDEARLLQMIDGV